MKRSISLLLTVIMVMGMLPATALAAAAAPQNPRWYQGAYLQAEWDQPNDGGEGYLYDIIIYYSESEDGPWTYIDFYDDWEKSNVYALDASYIAQYGNGYYKFRVRCSDKSCNGESEWVESEPYHLVLSNCTKTQISAPLSGSFDASTGELSWTDDENIDSNPQGYKHRAVVEMWYTGANGELDQSQWTLADKYIASGTSCPLSYFVSSRMDEGVYAFSINNLAEDYGWRGQSTTLILDERYTHVKPELESVPAPSGLYWTESRELRWDIPTGIENLGGVEFELLYSKVEPTSDADWATLEYFPIGFSSDSSEEEWTALMMEMSACAASIMPDCGIGWYGFRLRYNADNTELNEDSAWVYADALYYDGSLISVGSATNLTWNTVHMDNGITGTMNGTISFYVEEYCRFRLMVYRVDESGFEEHVGSNEGWLTEGWFNWNMFSDDGDRCRTGDYYYTIQLLGDGTTTSDGPVVTSDTWSYTRPDTVLIATDPVWDIYNMQVDFDLDTDSVKEVQVQFFFNGTGDNAGDANWIDSYTYTVDDLPPSIPQGLFSEYGEGWYWFKVYGVSADITAAVSSWSVLSPSYHYEKPDLVLNASDPGWDGTTLTWENGFGDESLVETYQIRFYQGTTEAEALAATDPVRTYRVSSAEMPWTVPTALLKTFGTGYYAYEVRVISANEIIAQTGDWSARSSVYHHEGAAQQAPAPADLQWDLYRNSRGTSAYNEYGTVSFGTSGAVGEEGQEYRIDFYRRSAIDGDVHVGTTWGWISYGRLYDSVSFFDTVDAENLLTGSYYFIVTAIGDGIIYADSESVISDEWTYTRPGTELWVSDPVWNEDMSMSWTGDQTGLTARYEVRFQWVHPDGTFYDSSWQYSVSFDADASRFAPGDDMLMNYGSGTWYYQVRALPDNHQSAVGSAWSEWSKGFTYNRPSTTLTAQNLGWTGDGKMTWDLGGLDLSMADSYRVYYYYSSQDTTFDVYDWRTYEDYSAEELPLALPTWIIRNWGIGYYAFSVQPCSADKTKALGGVQSVVSSTYYYEGASTPAPQATDLLWNTYRSNNGNTSREELGTVSFGVSLPEGMNYVQYKVDFYRKAETADGTDTHIGTLYSGTSSASIKYRRVYPFDEFAHQFQTGTYYFTVTTMGDGANYKDSEPVYSDVWTYTHPGVQLIAADPVWNEDMTMSWTEDTSDLLDYYEVRFQYVPQGGELSEDDWYSTDTYGPGELNKLPPAEMLAEYGAGTYYYRVRAVSQDLSEALHSGWSEWSEGFSYTLPDVTFKATDLQLDTDGMMCWSVSGDNDLIEKYRIRLYFSQSANTVFGEYDYRASLYYSGNSDSFQIPAEVITEFGPGYYSFSVLPLTGDPMQALGLWSNIGGSAYISGASEAAKAPTDPQWGVKRYDDGTSTSKPGVISFVNPYFDNYVSDTYFKVQLYRTTEDGDELVKTFTPGTNGKYINIDLFERIPEEMIYGSYMARICTTGDGVTLTDSEWVTLSSWTYERPDDQLTVAEPVWNGDMSMRWTNGDIAADYYQIRYQYVKPGGEFHTGNYNGSMTHSGDLPVAFPENWLEQNGTGTYYFKVMALSDDPFVTAPSAWSDWSMGYTYTENDNGAALPPTDLQWHYNGKTGVLAFRNPYYTDGKTSYDFRIAVVRRDASGNAEYVAGTNSGANSEYVTFDLFEQIPDKMTTGTYYFTAYTYGEDLDLGDSAIVTSGEWRYIRPDTQLSVSAPVWNDDMSMSWTNGDIAADSYLIKFQYVAPGGEFSSGSSNGSMTWSGTLPAPMDADLVERKGEGTYYFKVQARSDDPTVTAPSAWSDWSAGYVYPPVEEPVLSVPYNLAWTDEMAMNWSFDGSQPDHYEILVQRVRADEEFNPDNWIFSMAWYDEAPAILDAETLAEYGSAAYYFRLRAVYIVDGQAMYSDWSDWSGSMNYEEPDSLTYAEITEISEDTLTVIVAGTGEAELFIAAYNADGRMIGIEHTVMHEMAADGTEHYVYFEGEPAEVRVFALDGNAVPLGAAVALDVE